MANRDLKTSSMNSAFRNLYLLTFRLSVVFAFFFLKHLAVRPLIIELLDLRSVGVSVAAPCASIEIMP